jgi:hypothetical protein
VRKKFTTGLLIVFTLLFFSVDAIASDDSSNDKLESVYPEEYEENYMALIISAIKVRDFESAEQYTITRNKKIIDMGLEEQTFEWSDSFNLLCTIYQEGGGGSKITDDELLCYGCVVLNRVKSKDFPDTIEKVLTQKGQYRGFEKGVFLIDRTDNPLEIEAIVRCFDIALRVLNGEKGKNDNEEYIPDTVVWQSNIKQGEVWWQTESGTWFCY